METIHKYPIPMEGEFTLDMPSGARVLHVGTQANEPFLWALVTVDDVKRRRDFILGLTGVILPDVPGHPEYRGTFQLDGGAISGPFVGHVFEVVR